MKSKSDNILELFFEYPTKEWHFEEIITTSGVARSKVYLWTKKFVKEGLIKRVKEKGRMPYYTSRYDSPSYKNRKKLFAMTQLYTSGFLDHLLSLEQAKTVILFGSFSRSDWYKESDIDVFIYGDPSGLEIGKYELQLHKDIELFICQDKKELTRYSPGLIQEIVRGNIIKGDLKFVKVSADA